MTLNHERDHDDASDRADQLSAAPLDVEVPIPEPPDDESHEGNKRRGPSAASQLVALARKRYELFMSEDGRPYGRKIDGPNIALPLRGKAGLRSQLAKVYTEEANGAVASQSALADAMTVLEGIAASVEPRVPHLRTARYGDSIVVDLGTTDGSCVVIDPRGWRRESSSPVMFRRSGAMKPLPTPVRDGDGLAKLGGMLNTVPSGFRLVAAWLVAAFIPDLPHPILAFRGEQGTGKSFAAKMLIGIIDPSGAPKRTAPRDIKSWATQAFNSWALCLDNISIIPDWLSDALCRAVTGDGIVDRALYTDDDVVVLEFRRVLAITTIDAGALAGDLAERLLTVELHLISDRKRREESELDAAYADAHASILASLFDLLSDVLRVLPDVHLDERPRMADFARILAAVDKVMGWDTLSDYKTGASDAVSDVLEGEPFAQAVMDLVDAKYPNEVKLTAADLLKEVRTPERLPKKWPKDPTRAGGQLKRLAPALRTVGVEFNDQSRAHGGKRLYCLKSTQDRHDRLARERKGETASPASPGPGKEGSTSGNTVTLAASPPASPPTTVTDPVTLAPPETQTPDLREQASGDAGGAGGAVLHLLSRDPADPFDKCDKCGSSPTRKDGRGARWCSTHGAHLWRTRA